jgi:hypothetical protein
VEASRWPEVNCDLETVPQIHSIFEQLVLFWLSACVNLGIHDSDIAVGVSPALGNSIVLSLAFYEQRDVAI